MESLTKLTTVSQKLISLTEPTEWRAALENVPHTFGHTWESCYAMHLTTGYPTYLYVWQRGEAKVVSPLAERVFRGFTDVVTPYGFSGFVSNVEFPDFMEYWLQFAADSGYVCGYIGLNPILTNQASLSSTDAYESNRLYILDLRLSMQDLYHNLSQNRKRQLKVFEKKKQLYSLGEQNLKSFFISQYHNFFSRKEAASTYNFSLPTLTYLLDLEQVVLVGYALEGKVKAVSVFAHTVYMSEYLFNISLPGYESQAAPLLWYGALHLKEKQVPYLNLGGGVKPSDSIASFKQRFGPLDLPLTCLKQVYQKTAYTALCSQAQVDSGDKQSFFPPYWQYQQTQ